VPSQRRNEDHRASGTERATSGKSRNGGRESRLETDGIGRPAPPTGWRDVMQNDYEYPPQIDNLSRRKRRRAKKEWRRDDHAQRMAWLRDQRQAEPASPVSVLVVAVLLAVIILGIGGGLPKILGKDRPQQESVRLLTPAAPLSSPNQPASTGAPAATDSARPSPTDSVPSVQTESPSSAAIATANHVVYTWARLFYTRNPSTKTYEQLVTSVSQYMTPQLTASFTAQGDSTYDALQLEGGASTVVSSTVSAPKEGATPTDTSTRISRFVSVVIDITGKQPRRITVPLLVTVVPQDSAWVISDVDGGTGP
jgi:hypothetical protein